jgi:hypothetical protein
MTSHHKEIDRMAMRKPLKKADPNHGLVKARRIRTEKATARRLAGELEREAADLQRAAAILRRRAV